MIPRGAVVALVAAVAAVLALTRLDLHARRTATAEVSLGIERPRDARAEAVDGAVLAAIDEGAFGEELRLRLGRPGAAAEIDPFLMDVCEVAQGDFERFSAWFERHAGVPDGLPEAMLESSSTGHRVAGLLRSPASGVEFLGAEAYCQTLGGRLPWAEEWEAAASGREGRLYPWGNGFDGDSWPHRDALRNAAQACGSHPARATPGGVHDMAGGVMEWSRGRSGAEGGVRPAAHGAPAVRSRGRAAYALNAAWLEVPASTRSHHLGFRCVYPDRPPQPPPWGGPAPAAVPVEGGTHALGLPAEVRIARLAAVLPERQLRSARGLLAGEGGERSLRVGRCEVTRAEYRLFLADPLARLGLFANESEPEGESYEPAGWRAQLEEPALPVTGVSWWAADAFARWAGGRLPEAVEWELLAAGPEGRVYPWGNEYAPGAAVAGDGAGSVRPCGSSPADETGAGVRDLAGNVSEWTRSVAADRGGYAMWVQGGNWVLPGLQTGRSVFGRLAPLGHRSPDIGFRVVYDRGGLSSAALARLAGRLARGAEGVLRP